MDSGRAYVEGANLSAFGRSSRGATQYPLARTEAVLGISAPANDWKTVHSAATSERNMWLQFQLTSFGQDLVAGARLVGIMQAQSDPRLPDYFGKNASAAGIEASMWQPIKFPAGNLDASPIAGSNRNVPTFGQPIITYDETQLIIAEAALNATPADIAGAAIALNNVRTRFGKSAIPAPTLADIMTEKYIALFQNIETFNDFKRTCLPALTPALGIVWSSQAAFRTAPPSCKQTRTRRPIRGRR